MTMAAVRFAMHDTCHSGSDLSFNVYTKIKNAIAVKRLQTKTCQFNCKLRPARIDGWRPGPNARLRGAFKASQSCSPYPTHRCQGQDARRGAADATQLTEGGTYGTPGCG